MTASVICPRCEQGVVTGFRIRETGEIIQLCDECEATWPEVTEPAKFNFVDFTVFMKERGLSPLGEVLEDLD